jgi:hypothetical protein
MDREIVASTGEWAGAIAVVVTLFYLARQIKDANEVARGSARQAISQMNIDAWSVSIDSRVLSLASTKAVSGDELSPEEQGNYNRWIIMRMRFVENAFYQYQAGLLSTDEWIGYRQLIPFLVGTRSPAHENWKIAEVAFSPPFVSEVERVVSLDQGQAKASL